MVRNDGKLLEHVIHEICSGIKNATVIHNTKVKSKSIPTGRQVDVLIKGNIGAFEVKIEVEAKDYKSEVTMTKVDSFIGKIQDSEIDLGVMVSKNGFTNGAVQRAKTSGIQLFTAVSDKLGNSNLFIPVRCIIPEIKTFSIEFSGSFNRDFYLPSDIENELRLFSDGKPLNTREFLMKARNDGKIPQEKGTHKVNFDAVKIQDVGNPSKIQYCEVLYNVEIIEKYFLKIEPSVFLENYESKKRSYQLTIQLHSENEDMLKEWKEFNTFEEMNAAGDIDNQAEDIKNLIIKSFYKYDI